jgi:uncharacterized membrane protein YdjX (TVP38/TMEM64 family)
MWLDKASAWLDRYYRWPILLILGLIYVFVPMSKPGLAVVLMASGLVFWSKAIRDSYRNFRSGLHGSD